MAVLLGLALLAGTLYPNPLLFFKVCPPCPCPSCLPGCLLPEILPQLMDRFLPPPTFLKEVFPALPSLPTQPALV